jgi:F420H(2)-dependent biliverdin reductase
VPEELPERLRDEPLVWLSTVRPDGSPHTTPVWFVHRDGTWWIGCAAGSVKVRNVGHEPRVSLALPDGTAPVVAEGSATVLRSGFPADVVRGFAAKYGGWDVQEGPDRVLLEVRVTRWLLRGVAQ